MVVAPGFFLQTSHLGLSLLWLSYIRIALLLFVCLLFFLNLNSFAWLHRRYFYLALSPGTPTVSAVTFVLLSFAMYVFSIIDS